MKVIIIINSLGIIFTEGLKIIINYNNENIYEQDCSL